MFSLKWFGEKRLVKWVKLLPLSIKSINPVQKYPHIAESYFCILKMFVAIVDLSINFVIFFKYVLHQKFQISNFIIWIQSNPSNEF